MPESDRVKWNAKYQQRTAVEQQPDVFLTVIAEALPVRGRALDVAGGSGRQALWLAARGFDVTVCDISEVGLALAEEEAARRNLKLTTRRIDLEEEPLPAGPWDVIVCRYFLWRPLFAEFPEALAPGGHLIFIHSIRPDFRYSLEDGELPGLLAGLEVLRNDEGRITGGREFRVLARRPL